MYCIYIYILHYAYTGTYIHLIYVYKQESTLYSRFNHLYKSGKRIYIYYIYIYIYTYTYTHTHIYIYTYIHVSFFNKYN